MGLLDHLNFYFGYEAENMKDFIGDFRDDFEGEDEQAVKVLLAFLNSYSKNA